MGALLVTNYVVWNKRCKKRIISKKGWSILLLEEEMREGEREKVGGK